MNNINRLFLKLFAHKQFAIRFLAVLWVMFLCCAFQIHGQTITFNFSGKNMNNDMPMLIDEVYIVNETNGTDTLVVGNTFSILITAIQLFEHATDKIESYPNPFRRQVNISFHSNFYERAKVTLYTIEGKQLAQWDGFIDSGENTLKLSSEMEGILLLSIQADNFQASAKLICLEKGSSSEINNLTNPVESLSSVLSKSAFNINSAFEYRSGDSLSFTGYSGELVSEVIHDIPNGDKEYTFLFDVSDNIPLADFTASATAINQGDEVTFTDQSMNFPTSWHWNFGDGETSTVQNPGHVYSSVGTYTVTLIASNEFGSDTITKQDYIEVNTSQPIAAFTASSTAVNQGDAISFTDQSLNSPTSWHWDFGDGETSAVQNPGHVYSSAGTYTVTLIAGNTFGSDTITKQDYIEVNTSQPVADFTASATAINQGDEITFTDQSSNSPSSWHWDFGDDETSTVQNPGHVYSSVGIYTVTLIAGNEFGSDTITKKDYIEVNTSQPVADFTASATAINQGDEITFTDQSSNSPTSWHWDFGDGGTSEIQNPVYTYNSTGTYTVTLITGNAFGTDTITKKDYIEVNTSQPTAAFTASATAINQGDEITFTDQSTNSPTSWHWDFGDGAASELQNPGHVYSSIGTYTVTLMAGNAFGSDTISKQDYITVSVEESPVLSISTDSLAFGTSQTQLNIDIANSGTGTLSWSIVKSIAWLSVNPESGETSTTTDQVSVTVNRTGLTVGTYIGNLTISSNGGSKEVTVTMEVSEQTPKETPKEPGWQ